jgi:dihydroorotate dehydrogenase electron transfer subunit
MRESMFRILSNRQIAHKTYEIILRGNTEHITNPGQFVNIKLEGFYLRRPFSVCDLGGDCMTLVYKVVGSGTEKMSTLEPNEELNLLTGLGNGYDTGASGNTPLLIGGGAGVPPLYWLAKALLTEEKKVTAILGFNTSDEVFYEKEFERLGVNTFITTVDGSYGTKGLVTDALSKAGTYSYTYTCGPEPMLKAVFDAAKSSGQYSFEERMGCGFGACMGCTCKTLYGDKRICREGPVLAKEEIIWPD